MVLNPNRGVRQSGDDPERSTALYALNADLFDGAQMPGREAIDPVAAAQYEAGEAALALNSKPADQRTAGEIARVERLSEVARALATDANASLVTRDGHFGETS